MIIRTIEVGGRTIWLSIDQHRVYSQDTNMIDSEEEFLCHFKLTEPTPLIYGELCRDANGKPLLFDTVDNAVIYAKKELTKRWTK